jgi:hypothetical protein
VAGVFGGEWIDHYDVVLPYRTDVYHLAFFGGETAVIEVDGDNSTDLDCRVYDQNDHLIARDIRSSDYCRLQWVPAWTGTFRLEIRNLGSASNLYEVSTN